MTTVALAGNPNAGKSTLFNALTGARQHVGNWPGKTVERKEGTTYIDGHAVGIVDLPGTYSLSAYSVEELITRQFILEEQPDAVVAVVDAGNLARNLYLVVQLLELGAPLILVLNMCDVAEARGIRIDTDILSERLDGIPVIKTVGTRSVGVDALKSAIWQATQSPQSAHSPVDYGAFLTHEIDTLREHIAAEPALAAYHPVWLAIKLLEEDEALLAELEAKGHTALTASAHAAANRVESAMGEEPDILMADRRYLLIGSVIEEAVTRPPAEALTRSDKIDRIVTHRWMGLPIFLLLMWVVFQFVANVSAPMVDWINGVIEGPVARWVVALLGTLGLGGTWVESLVVDGIIAGVGGVLVFVPVLFFLYLAIALLEDSGYMARAAFVMDDFMQRLGLHGKSFLPMLIGFGCTVPAIYATRTLESERDRKLTAFLVPFMSCGARLPVYVIFGTAFFGAAAGGLIFGMYLLGIAIAILTGFMLKNTLFKDKPTMPLLMEMPPYRTPLPKNVWFYMWRHISEFLRKAATVILAASVVLWFLMAIPVGAETLQESLFGQVSGIIAPVFRPAGFDDWEPAGALITGFVAKEVIVSTLSQAYLGETSYEKADLVMLGEDLVHIGRTFGEALVLTAQETVNIVPRTVNILPIAAMPEANILGTSAEEADTTALESALREAFTPLAAVAFTVFVLLYVPCMASLAAIRQEFGTRWTLLQIAYTLGVAWLAAVVIYQGGRLLGLG